MAYRQHFPRIVKRPMLAQSVNDLGEWAQSVMDEQRLPAGQLLGYGAIARPVFQGRCSDSPLEIFGVLQARQKKTPGQDHSCRGFRVLTPQTLTIVQRRLRFNSFISRAVFSTCLIKSSRLPPFCSNIHNCR